MRRTVFAVVAGLLISVVSASAHHGYASFHQDQTVTILGTLESVIFRNPHVVMQIRLDNGEAYTVTWDAATTLGHWQPCVTPSTLKVGDRLVVSGAPHIDPAHHELAQLKEVRRPSDGWNWTKKDRYYAADLCGA